MNRNKLIHHHLLRYAHNRFVLSSLWLGVTMTQVTKRWTYLVFVNALTLFIPLTLANPTAGDLAQMRMKQGEVEYVSKQRVEQVLTRLCPGRCELIDLTVNVSMPKAVGRVLPGFDTPTASEVEVEGIEARVMIDSALPRTFRSNLPQMLSYRLSDLSAKVVITPIQLRFPSPQLPPSPPPLPEVRESVKARPQPAPVPAPAPILPEPITEPIEKEEPPQPPSEPTDLVDLLLPWVPLGVILLFVSVLTLFVLRQLRQFQEALDGDHQKKQEEREYAMTLPRDHRLNPAMQSPYANSREEDQASMPDLTDMLQSLKASRTIQNKVLRRWLEDDAQEVGLLISLLGADIMTDLKQDRTLKAPLESLSHQVASLRTPVSSSQAWQLSYALKARLNAAQILHDERALGATWEFMHGLSINTLKQLFDPLSAAEQSHFIGQLPMEIRSVFLAQITGGQRQSLMLFAGADSGLNRAQSLDLAHRLKRRSEELNPMGEEMSAQATLIIDMLNALPFAQQLESLLPLESQRPQVAHAVMRQLCLEEVIGYAPSEVLMEAILRTPFDVTINTMRGLSEPLSQLLLASAPPHRAMAYAEELEVPVSVRQSDFLNGRASFLQCLSSALKREGIDLLDLNLKVISAYRGYHQ
jgi:hypothetical protein